MKVSRRRFLCSLPLIGGGVLAAESFIEPGLIEKTRLDFRHLGIGKRIVHFSDHHYKGDRDFAREVRERIHRLEPDYVFFTGDMLENQSRDYLDEAMEWVSEFEVPTYGIVGNHDPLDNESITAYREAYAATRGRFLFGERVELDGFVLHGSRHAGGFNESEALPKILLCHFPIVGDRQMDEAYDLILAGHSHGGQIRLPFVGALVLPPEVGRYERGLYETPAGNLYVNVGVGTYILPMRLFCRPEITEILL